MKKKIIALFLSISMLFCFSACGEKETNSMPNDDLYETQSDFEYEYEDTNEASTDEIEITDSSNVTSSYNETTSTQTNQSPPTHIHSYSAATCTMPQYCSCGATAGIALGHNYSSATCTSPQICIRCGETYGNPLEHSYLEPTCVSPKICNRCNNVADSALGHNFVNKKCTRCGKLDRTYLIEDIEIFDSDSIKYDIGAFDDNQGNSYVDHYSLFGIVDWGDAMAEFQISKKYSKFSATAFLPYEDRTTTRTVCITIYGDEKILYKTQLSKGCYPETFTIDVSGVSVLKIYYQNFGNMMSSSENNARGVLANAYLEK